MAGQWRSLIIEYGLNLVKEIGSFITLTNIFYPIRQCVKNRKSIEPKNNYVAELIAAMEITPLRRSLFQADSITDPSLIKHWLAIIFVVILLMGAQTGHCADDVVVQTLCDLNADNLGCIFTHYKVGDTDTLVAEPEAGYYFAGWGGICTGRGDCTFTITQEGQRLELTARFEKLPDKPKNLRGNRK